MNEEILKELQSLRETVNGVQLRIRELEGRIVKGSGAALKPRLPSVKPTPVVRPDMETTIGRYWLNRLGVGSLVFGVAFFILYSFQYLGPWVKLGIGFAAGLGLLLAGTWLERRSQFPWYARGLMGGGWAILYFTTYAMHHLPGVRVLDSAWADLLLLAAVAAGAIRHSLRYRSQIITALAFLLAFITAAISQVTTFTLLSSVLLAAGLVILVTRMQWHRLALYGVAATYGVHLVWIMRQISLSRMVAVHAASVAEVHFWLSIGFVLLYWLTYAGATLLLEEDRKDKRNLLVGISLVNNLLFAQLALFELGEYLPAYRYLACLGMGALACGFGALARRQAHPAVSVVNVLTGLSLITLAIPMKLSGTWTSFFWLMESAVLAAVGLRYDRFRYRAFAFTVAMVTGLKILFLDLWRDHWIHLFAWKISWPLFIGLFAIGVLSGLAALYRIGVFQPVRRPVERFGFRIYLGMAALLGVSLILAESQLKDWIVVLWGLEAAVLTLLGLGLGDRLVRFLGAAVFAPAALVLFFDYLWPFFAYGEASRFWVPERLIWTAELLFGAGFGYRQLLASAAAKERWFAEIYTCAASGILTRLAVLTFPRQWLSVALAVEGLGLLAAGFWLKDRGLRWSALAVFGFLVMKILFVDLAGVATIYRILSFIVAGVIFLLASFAYARYK